MKTMTVVLMLAVAACSDTTGPRPTTIDIEIDSTHTQQPDSVCVAYVFSADQAPTCVQWRHL